LIWFNFWLAFGIAAQFCFFLRFFVQWIASEKKKKSTIPVHFWHLSLLGGVGLLVYSIHIRDPVFIVGQGCGIFIYVRNLMLIHEEKSRGKSKT